MNYPSSPKQGFTIIELLVAVGVTALMVSLMLTIVVNVLGGWNRSSGSLTSGNQARTVMDLMTSDLQSAILRRDGNVWMVATVQQTAIWAGGAKPATTASSAADINGSLYIPAFPSPLTNPPVALEDYRFGQGGMTLRLFTTVPDTNASITKLSAPRAVSYRISRQAVTSSGSESKYLLYRSELDPQATFSAGYNLFAGSYTGTSFTAPSPNDLIANNVVDFGVRFYKQNTSSQLIPIFPNSSDRCFAVSSDVTKVGAGIEASPKPDFPTVAEIFVRILTDEGALKIANLENGVVTGETWWGIVLANSKVFTRRIDIKGTSL